MSGLCISMQLFLTFTWLFVLLCLLEATFTASEGGLETGGQEGTDSSLNINTKRASVPV